MNNEDTISLWQHIHGATTHFPIALAFVSIAFDFGAVLFKKETWRTVGFWLLIATVILILPAIGSGLYYIYLDATGKKAFAEGLTQATVIQHRNYALIGGGILLIPAAIRIVKRDDMPRLLYLFCLLLTLSATAFIGFTGYKGAYVQRGY